MQKHVLLFAPWHIRASRLITACILLVTSTLALLTPATVHAASVTANVFTDPTPGQCATTGTGNCSLREAVIYADAHPNSAVYLLPYVYHLTIPAAPPYDATTGSLQLTASTNIYGASVSASTIEADGTNASIFFLPVAGISVTIANLTIQGANTSGSGGGIYNRGATLTLTNSIVQNNVAHQLAGGIYSFNGATTTITDSIIQNNSSTSVGGIESNDSTLMLANSQVRDNSAPFDAGMLVGGHASTAWITNSTIHGNVVRNTGGSGGGIDNSGTLVIDSSTISNNIVASNDSISGAGILNYGTITLRNSVLTGNAAGGPGGGLGNQDGTVTVLNSTISGNWSNAIGGGIFNQVGSTVTLTNATVANNSDGLYSDGTTSSTNSLFANNVRNCYGNITSGDHNLSSDASCAVFNQPHDLTNVAPLIAPLALNGGPTATHALQPSSPAIDAGGSTANGCPATDQRGVARPQGAACDIGAFEAGGTPVNPTPTLAIISPTSGSSAGGTTVTITGTGFAPGIVVSFGSTAVMGAQVVNSTTLTVMTPAHSAGDVNLTVVNQNQAPGTFGAVLPNAFRYVDPIASIHSSGPTNGMPQPQPGQHPQSGVQSMPPPEPNPHTGTVATGTMATPTVVMPTPAPQPVRH